MTLYNVSNAAEFNTAFANAVGGDRIVLASGNYGAPYIQNRNFNSYVTIQAAVGTSVHFDGLTLLTSKNLSFSGIDIGRALNPGEPEWTQIATIRDSANVKFSGMTFHGSLDGDPSNDGLGLAATNVSGLWISNSEFTELNRGITVQTSSNVSIANNNVHLIQVDGLDSAGNDGIVIDGNRFSDFHPLAGDHADAIQFFNTGLTKGSTNITVKNNVLMQTYFSGVEGTGVQGIWITDGGDYGYKNVLVQNNLLYSNDLYNGLTVNQAMGVQIIGNTVVSNPTDGKMFWIRLENDTGVSLQNNVTDNILSSNVSQFFQSGNVNFAVDPTQSAKIANLLHPTDVHDLIFPGNGYQLPAAAATAPVSNALGSGIANLISTNHSASTSVIPVTNASLTSVGSARSALVSVVPVAEPHVSMSLLHDVTMPHFSPISHFDHFVAMA